MHENALRDAATVLCALSKWEYWHGSKERSEELNRVAAHLIMWANVGSRLYRDEAGRYMNGAARLVKSLSQDMAP